ncbi:Retinol dehydrogenase 12 [Lobulomyces angularis]|nr:Retinol dehydrogenase 12 [Lobulomyces angularis]
MFACVPKVPTNVNLNSKHVIVTGSNTGIGLEMARHLYKLGANVTLACRNEKKANEAIEDIKKSSTSVFFEGGNLNFGKIDFNSLDSVRNFSKSWNEKPLHILINNAGLIDNSGEKTEDGFEKHFGVNYLGPFLLTNLLLPSLKRSYQDTGVKSRVITVASAAHYRPGKFDLDDIELIKTDVGKTDSFMPVNYGISKTQNVMFARELSKREKDNGIISISNHPGVIKSDLWRNKGSIFSTIANLTLRNVVDGAATSLFAALDPSIENNPEYLGAYLDSDGKIKKPADQCLRDEDCSLLWEKSETLSKLH